MAIIKNKFGGVIEAGSNSQITSDATYGNPDHSIITGGLNNRICAAAHSFIGTGSGNYISKWNNSGYVFIGTGCNHCVQTGGVVSGICNTIGWNATHSFIGGGCNNQTPQGDLSAVVGGCSNNASGGFSFVGGGKNHTATGCVSTVAGGLSNSASTRGFVGGGVGNSASGYASVIAGGNGNQAGGKISVVLGGWVNCSTAYGSFIGGGRWNKSFGINSVVVGGGDCISGGGCCACGNCATGDWSSIVGGAVNKATGIYSSVVGGCGNTASTYGSFIGGGKGNTVSSTNYSYGVIVGGNNNINCHSHGFLGGGFCNRLLSDDGTLSATLVGGACNTLTGRNGFLGGGANNTGGGYSDQYTTLVGGSLNTISDDYGFIGGGSRNISSGNHSVVVGGACNSASGIHSSVLGGCTNTASGAYSITAGRQSAATKLGSTAFGRGGCSTFPGQFAQGSEYLLHQSAVGAGLIQFSDLLVYNRALINTDQFTSGQEVLLYPGDDNTLLLKPGQNKAWHVTAKYTMSVIEIVDTVDNIFVGDSLFGTVEFGYRNGTNGFVTSAIRDNKVTNNSALNTGTFAFTYGASQEIVSKMIVPEFTGGGSLRIRANIKFELVETIQA